MQNFTQTKPPERKRKHRIPEIGEKIGASTVVGYSLGGGGAYIFIACECGSSPRRVPVGHLSEVNGCQACKFVELKKINLFLKVERSAAHINLFKQQDAERAKAQATGTFCTVFPNGGKRNKYPIPKIGERFGESEVVGYTPDGNCTFVYIQCSCGRPARKAALAALNNHRLDICKTCSLKKADIIKQENKQKMRSNNTVPEGYTIQRPSSRTHALYPLPHIGDIFGQSKVVGYMPDGSATKVYVECSCGCAARPVRRDALHLGQADRCKACGHNESTLKKNIVRAERKLARGPGLYIETRPSDRFSKLPIPKIGDKFGSIEVVGFMPDGMTKWVFVKCLCGTPVYRVQRSALYHGKHDRCVACGHAKGRNTRSEKVRAIKALQPKPALRGLHENSRSARFYRQTELPNIGEIYGENTVVRIEYGPDGGVKGILVQCSCGVEPHSVEWSNLRRGHADRCRRCAQKKAGRTRSAPGKAICPDVEVRTSLMRRINAIYRRCTNPEDASYESYGKRFSLHEPWRENRLEFLRYLTTLEDHDQLHLEIDRIDNDLGYMPGNLHFVTRKVNLHNRRNVNVLSQQKADLELKVKELELALVSLSAESAESA
ncbi:Zn ribbon nucleic-acid-binding protein [Pseudomonas corrugata]|uniref:hypothetical protein n=1 Tax=Pseudomonas corrugata TaxID=47879 RepID=UPI002862DB00|nr:hypothetical protein [Pseudomonas corrugata]MDR7283435.1 Zn ribbon nucleic-acid-binding protein [Pseudomonas corrugata]